MKTVILIRHAKSDQYSFNKDISRPLNERGLRDAPVMAKRLREKIPVVNALITSPSLRTQTTAGFFADEYGIDRSSIIIADPLYLAGENTIIDVIASTDERLDTIAVFCHNPGITYLAATLVSTIQIDNMPTCGMLAVTADISSWAAFAKAKKAFLFFDYPKNN